MHFERRSWERKGKGWSVASLANITGMREGEYRKCREERKWGKWKGEERQERGLGQCSPTNITLALEEEGMREKL